MYGYVELLGNVSGKLYRTDGCKPCLKQVGVYAKTCMAYSISRNLVEAFLHLRFRLFAAVTLYLWFGQFTFRHLAVYIVRYLLNLHCDSRNHIWRLLRPDVGVKLFNVNSSVCHNVCSQEFSASRVVKRLNCGILNALELTYHLFNLCKLNAESAYLHLSVISAHKVNVAVWQIAYHIASSIHALITLLLCERVLYKHFCGFLRAVIVTSAHLMPGYAKLTASPYRQHAHIFVNNVEFGVKACIAYRLQSAVILHVKTCNVCKCLRRTVTVNHIYVCRWYERCKFLSS